MERIKQFMDFLLKKEQEAIYAGKIKAEFEKYNALATEIKSYMMDSSVGFGLPVLTSPKPDFLYDEDSEFPNPRNLFKISEYKHNRYGSVWACYVSVSNSGTTVKRISNCFLVAEINGDLKIIAKMSVDPDTKKWIFYGGDEDKSLRLHSLGTPVKIERYVEPISNDDWSLKEYLKDK